MQTIIEGSNAFTPQLSPNDVSYIDSHSLFDIEQGIADSIRTMIQTKKAVCIALARIKQKELYRQADIGSFKDYLKTHRIPIRYSTAIDYSIIGEMLIKYEEELRYQQFEEEMGLQKLLLLEKGLSNHPDQPEAVFKRLNNDSFRDFRQFVSQKKTASEKKSDDSHEPSSSFFIRSDDERIYLMPHNIDLLWLNTDMEEELGIHGLNKKFHSYLLGVVKEFFDSQIK